MSAAAQRVGEQRQQATRPQRSGDQMDEQAVGPHVVGPPADECPVRPSGINVSSEPANSKGVSDQRSTGMLATVTIAARNAVHRHAPAVLTRPAADQIVSGFEP